MINKIQPTIDAISPDSLREGNSTGRMSREEFLRLLTTQLQHQDPTDPMDNSKVLEQLSMLDPARSSIRTKPRSGTRATSK